MGDQFGEYKGQLYYVGSLSPLYGAIANGSEFKRFDGSRVPCGCGNRIKLFVDTNIITEVPAAGIDPYPGLDDYGLVVGFDFNGQDAPGDEKIVRTPDYGTEFPSGLPVPSPPTEYFMEATMDGVAAGSGEVDDFNYVEANYQVYRLSRLRSFQGTSQPFGNPMLVLPIKAQGDFLRCFAYINPPTYTFDSTKFIHVWAMVGGDAQ